MKTPILVTAPSVEPVTLSEAKVHLNVATALTTADDWITAAIKAARRRLEQLTGRAFINQSWKLQLDDADLDSWANKYGYYVIELPLPAPLSSVTTIIEYDEDGTASTVSSSDYTVLAGDLGRVIMDEDFVWEGHRPFGGVIVTYVAGYGSAQASVDPDIQQIIKEIVAYSYHNRGSGLKVEGASIDVEIPPGLMAHIAPWVVMHL